jgi:hypothetical protein
MRSDVSKRLRDPDYAAVCRARLHGGDDARSRLPGPTPPGELGGEPPALASPPVAVRPRSSVPTFLRRPILTSSVVAALLMPPLATIVDRPQFAWDDLWAAAANVMSGSSVMSGSDATPLQNAPAVHIPSASENSSGHVREATAEPAQAEPLIEFAKIETAEPVPGPAGDMIAPEPPSVIVPEVTLVLLDPLPPASPAQANQKKEMIIATPSAPTSALALRDRDFLVQKGDEALERGDVSGARLLYRRAADSGDARAALGMARTFDAKVLRTLRVYGVRPDPDQAVFWYGRSKALGITASH